MIMKRTMLKRYTLSIVLSICVFAISASAQGSAFNFQGRLNDGANPANGIYDLQFTLFNSITGGAPIGPTVPRPNTTLIIGVFSVNLDFGAAAFNNPDAVFIEIGVKPSGSPNAFTILGPRQQLTVVPYAVRAANATNADNSTNAVNSQNAANASTLNGLNSSSFIRNSTTPQPNSNFNIDGNGVINGTLNVTGNATIGSPTVTGNLSISGNFTAAGNAAQNRDKSGFVKAMAFIGANGQILRCFNAITGSTTNNCGFAVTLDLPGFGRYGVDFGFQVNDRFVSITPLGSDSVTLAPSFTLQAEFPNRIFVNVNITDIDHSGSNSPAAFMIIIY